MNDKDEIKVTMGENHTPSAATISVAESLKNDGNALLAGEMVVHVVVVVRVGGGDGQQEDR